MKKVLGFYFVILLCSTAVVFSQNMISTQRWRCKNLAIIENGRTGADVANSVSYVNVNRYSDNGYQIIINYNDGSSPDYLYLRNGNNRGNGIFYEASFSKNNQRVFDLGAFVSGGWSSTAANNIIIYQNGRESIWITLIL